jgi:hypothetical protein
MKTKRIALQNIVIDDGVLIRSEINKEHLDDLIDAMKQSKELPPVVVFADGETFNLVDGLHRYRAAQKCNWEKIEATVHEGSKREATLFACGVNAGHGLRRTNEDKRRAVLKLLTDNEWSGWGDAVIAKHCAVTQAFVYKLTTELTNNGYEFPNVRTGLNGKKYKTSKKGMGQKEDKNGPDYEKSTNEDNIKNSEHAELNPQVQTMQEEPPLHTEQEITDVGVAITNLNIKMVKLNKMIQEKKKWSKNRKAKARAIKEIIDQNFIIIATFLKKITD